MSSITNLETSLKQKTEPSHLSQSCYNCFSTDNVKKYGDKWICEKCAIWYDPSVFKTYKPSQGLGLHVW